MANLFSNYVHMVVGKKPEKTAETHIADDKDSLVNQIDESINYTYNQLFNLRTLARDSKTRYDSFDEIAQDSTIAAALELYADDATQTDEQGRVIWVESDQEEISDAGNRLLKIMEIPERAWKHIYLACKYGDFYLRLYRNGDEELEEEMDNSNNSLKVINDKKLKDKKKDNHLEEYVEDVADPAVIFDLKTRGKTVGFAETPREQGNTVLNQVSMSMNKNDIKVYPPDRFIHMYLSEDLSRDQEELEIQFDNDKSTKYKVSRGKSALADVYGIQKQLSLLEDTLALSRLVRSPLIRLLEIEVGDMPKNEVNPYLRRFKQLIEHHVSIDKDSGDYKSFSAPGPIDNLIIVPTKNGKGVSNINTLGGDVNVKDIADLTYFSNKRAGALKIPRSYLGDDSEGSSFDNGGTLTRISIRYARTIKRIQKAYIRAISQMLNLFFLDKGLDYVNKFEVRMTSPSTQEDLERNELVGGNLDLVSSIMDLTESLEGDTQKEILMHLFSNVLKMTEIASIIEKDGTPPEDVDIQGSSPIGNSYNPPSSSSSGNSEISDATDVFSGDSNSSSNNGSEFTDDEYSSFEDEI